MSDEIYRSVPDSFIAHVCEAVDNLNDLPISEQWAKKWTSRSMRMFGDTDFFRKTAPQTTQEAKLFELCQKFIEEQGIHCAETIYQTDRVIENAYQFIEQVCDIVGYQKDPEDE